MITAERTNLAFLSVNGAHIAPVSDRSIEYSQQPLHRVHLKGSEALKVLLHTGQIL